MEQRGVVTFWSIKLVLLCALTIEQSLCAALGPCMIASNLTDRCQMPSALDC